MNNSVYTLNNGPKGLEDNRLEFQHRRFTLLTGGLLPDHIWSHLNQLESRPAVADVGTGTGIWLRDLAKELPSSARLDGFDYDTTKFPDRTTLPENVVLRFANILEPFPESHQGLYDIVHVRLLIYALREDSGEWVKAARNLMMLLKPGGWLIWDELSNSSIIAMPLTHRVADWLSLVFRYCKSVGTDPKSV